MFGGRLRRSEVGDCARRAQSSGEWPGWRLTWREGFLGMDVAVGGGMSPEWLEGAPRRGMGRLREVGVGEARRGIPLRVGMRFPVVAGDEGEGDGEDALGLAMRVVVGETLRGAVGGEGRRDGVGDERPAVVSEGTRRKGEEEDAGRGMPDVRGFGSLELGTGGGGMRSEGDFLGGAGSPLGCVGEAAGGGVCPGATRLSCGGGWICGGAAFISRSNSGSILKVGGGAAMVRAGGSCSGVASGPRSEAGSGDVTGSILNAVGGVMVKDGGERDGCCCWDALSSDSSGVLASSGRFRWGTGSSPAVATAFGVVCSSSSSSSCSWSSSSGIRLIVVSCSQESSIWRTWLSRSSSRSSSASSSEVSATPTSTRGSCITIGGGRDKFIAPFSFGSGTSASSALGSPSSSSACSIGGLGVGPVTLRWVRLASKLGSQAGGRKQKRTTDATRREIPMIDMVRGDQTRDGCAECARENTGRPSRSLTILTTPELERGSLYVQLVVGPTFIHDRLLAC